MGSPAWMRPRTGTRNISPMGSLPGDAKAARDLAVAFDVAALLQLIEIVIHHRGRGNAAALADLANGRRVLVLALVILNEIQDALVAFAQTLAFSDHHHVRLLS